MITKRSGSLLAVLLIAAVGFGQAAPVRAASAVDTLYAELAKLPPAERHQRLVEGAKKEGSLVSVPIFRGALGADHANIFRKRYPELKVEAQDMQTEDATERLIAEETAGRHLTDAVGVSTADLNLLIARDLLAVYPTPANDAILPRFKSFLDPQHRWVAWTWEEHGISYNSDLLKKEEAPKSWEDLCNPRFKGQVSFDPGERKFLVGVFMMMGEQKYKQWMECVGNNSPIIMKGHTQRITLMLAGDHAVQGDNFLYRGALLKSRNPKKAPFEIVWTAPILGRPDVTIINKSTTRPHASALWADWHLSDESQQYVAKNFRPPLTMSHPFIPDDAEIFMYGVIKEEDAQKASKYWTDYVGRKS